MAALFQRDDPILLFRLRPDPRAGDRRYLLWPAWAWRVVAPEVRDRQLNVLQKAVLSLSQAGVVTAERVSRTLCLELDLAAFIASELLQHKWTDSKGQITPEGRQVLEEETLQSRKMVTGFVFQDPWSHELWPRFVENLEYARTTPGKKGFPELILGSTGDPKPPLPAYMHLPVDVNPASIPDAQDIIEVARRHQRALRHQDRSVDADEEDSSTFEPNPVDIDRVSLIEERPLRVFLSTHFYLPRDSEKSVDWQVCDPFGLGSSPLLRRAITRQMERSPLLRERVEGLLSDALKESLGEVRAWMERLQSKAELALEGRLTSEVRRLPYHEQLLELMLAYVEAEELGEDKAASKFPAVLLAARKVIEALFAQLIEEHPGVGLTRRLSHEPAHCASVYDSTAKELGFQTPLPRALANVRRTDIEAIVRRRDFWRLRAMIVANLLAARDDPRHPLRKVARLEQRLFAELDDIATVLGSQMHHGSKRLGGKAVQDTVHQIYRVVGLISGLDDGSRNPPLR